MIQPAKPDGKRLDVGEDGTVSSFSGLAEQIGGIQTELLRAINRDSWINGYLAELLIAIVGMSGVLIGSS